MSLVSDKTLGKLDRPPSGPNWVRFIFDDPTRTAKAIVAFAKGQPPFTYQPAYRAIKDRLEFGIDRETALQAVSTRGAPAGRVANRAFIEAFLLHDGERRYSAANAIDFEREYFRVSRDVLVPVAPLSIIREKGQFVPIFACGWTSNPLTLLQRRLLMTIYEDAFLSLTDYQNSPAEILFFPETIDNGEKTRKPEIWERGTYTLLSSSELNECVEIFLLARDKARAVLAQEIADATRSTRTEPLVTQVQSMKDLFEP